MPELGESVHEGTVSRWLKKEGDTVTEDEPVVEIMTDKVNTELPAPASGVLSKILIPEGSPVAVFAAMVSAVGSFWSIPYYPVWNILILALDVGVIWAVVAHGHQLKPAE